MTPTWAIEISTAWWTMLAIPAVKCSLLLAAAAVAVRGLRGHSHAVRHRVWQCALVFAGLLPLAAWCAPQWSVLPAWMNAEAVLSGEALAGSPLTASQTWWGGARAVAVWLCFGAAAVWAVGAAIAACRTLGAALSLTLLRRASDRVEQGPLAAWVAESAARMGVRQRVELLFTDQRTSPMTWGVLRPCILMPREALGWPARQRELALLHELAHIRRHDCWTQWCVQAAAILYWFNPQVNRALEQLRWEREGACDDLVLAAGARATDYAESLLALSHPQRTAAPLGAAAMAEPEDLEQRLRAILDPRRVRAASLVVHCGAALAVVALAAPLSMLRPRALPTSEPSTVSTSPTTQNTAGRASDLSQPAAGARAETLAAAAKRVKVEAVGAGAPSGSPAPVRVLADQRPEPIPQGPPPERLSDAERVTLPGVPADASPLAHSERYMWPLWPESPMGRSEAWLAPDEARTPPRVAPAAPPADVPTAHREKPADRASRSKISRAAASGLRVLEIDRRPMPL